MPTSLDDHPSLPLSPARHQQVRALLVREARTSPARRWVVPVAVAASVAVVAAGTQLLGGDDGTAPATAPPPAVDCAAAQPPLTPADVPDAWRLLPVEGGVTNVVVHRSVTACGTFETPLEVLAQVAADGTVVSALTLWTDRPRPGGWEASFSPLRVRGTDGIVTTDPDSTDTALYWSEGGRDLSVSASGVDREQVLALVEALTDGGTTVPVGARPAGTAPLGGWEPVALDAEEPVLTFDVDAGRPVRVVVSRTDRPWQATLSEGGAGSRLVDVGGRPGFVRTGTGNFVAATVADGVQAVVFSDEAVWDGDLLLQVARSLEPVAADDPRLAPTGASTP